MSLVAEAFISATDSQVNKLPAEGVTSQTGKVILNETLAKVRELMNEISGK